MSVAITIDNVVKRFGKDTIINGLSVDVRPGEFFTLLGPSGCGKTTLLRMIYFISGFFILLEDQLRTGDWAVINGTEGLVEKIELSFFLIFFNKSGVSFLYVRRCWNSGVSMNLSSGMVRSELYISCCQSIVSLNILFRS